MALGASSPIVVSGMQLCPDSMSPVTVKISEASSVHCWLVLVSARCPVPREDTDSTRHYTSRGWEPVIR